MLAIGSLHSFYYNDIFLENITVAITELCAWHICTCEQCVDCFYGSSIIGP